MRVTETEVFGPHYSIVGAEGSGVGENRVDTPGVLVPGLIMLGSAGLLVVTEFISSAELIIRWPNAKPVEPGPEWEDVGEASVWIGGALIEVVTCDGDTAAASSAGAGPGWYRVRVAARRTDGFRRQREVHLVEIWPERPSPPRAIRLESKFAQLAVAELEGRSLSERAPLRLASSLTTHWRSLPHITTATRRVRLSITENVPISQADAYRLFDDPDPGGLALGLVGGGYAFLAPGAPSRVPRSGPPSGLGDLALVVDPIERRPHRFLRFKWGFTAYPVGSDLEHAIPPGSTEVSVCFKKQSRGCQVDLNHEGVPESLEDAVREIWQLVFGLIKGEYQTVPWSTELARTSEAES